MRRISGEVDIQTQLRAMARDVVSDIAEADPLRSRELLSTFVSELVLAIADQSQREDRRQKQAEGIAAARARGVRLGRPPKPLPEHFDEIHQIWREGKLTLGQAADACGMPESSFYSAAVRKDGLKGTPCRRTRHFDEEMG